MLCPIQNSGNPGILLDYCTRRLDSDAMVALKRHMAVCPECRTFAEAQETVWTALDYWDAAPVSRDFDERLYARISEHDRRKFWSRIFGDSFSWKPALSFGAACATLAIAVVLNAPDSQQERQTPPAIQPAALVETLEPEQIERSIEDFEMLRQFSTPAPTV